MSGDRIILNENGDPTVAGRRIASRRHGSDGSPAATYEVHRAIIATARDRDQFWEQLDFMRHREEWAHGEIVRLEAAVSEILDFIDDARKERDEEPEGDARYRLGYLDALDEIEAILIPAEPDE